MKLNPSDLKPIYIQISEGIEDDILNGLLAEESECYSQYQIAKLLNINPATAAKGISLLVQEGILYKVRGLGMHVSKGAGDAIRKKRRQQFMTESIVNTVQDAKKLGISKDELKEMIDGVSLPKKEENS